MKKIAVFHLGLSIALLAAGTVTYVRYWDVATVNGMPISRIDFIRTMEKQGGKQTLETMIDEALILGEGKNKGVKIDQTAINNEIANIENRLKTQGQTLDAALQSSGMTREELNKQVKLKLIETALSAPKTEITQAEIDEFLKANKSLLPTGKTKDELQALAKEQLTYEASQSAATKWLDNLRQSAKVIYK